MNVATTITEAARRLCNPTESALIGASARPTFRRADFRLRWMATRLHTFVFVVDVPAAASVDVVGLAEETRVWARQHKGGLPGGLQTGCAAVPVFVLPEIGEVRDWVQSPQPLKWAAALFPIVVSSSGSDCVYRTEAQRAGVIYESFLRELAGQLVGAAVSRPT